MLTQVHPVPLTEENLKKHQRETTSNRISLRNTKRRSKSGKSLRSAGDGESIKFYREEALNASLDENQGCEKKKFSEGESPGDSATNFAEDMNEERKTNSKPEIAAKEAEIKTKADSSALTEKEELSEGEEGDKPSDNIAANEAETNPKGDNSALIEKDVLSEQEEGVEFSQKEKGSHEYDGENADESEKELGESEQEGEGDEDDNSDESSDESSSLDSESDVVTAVAKNDIKNAEDTNETGTSTRSSSPVGDEDDEDDDYSVDDDDDETEDEEEAEEAEKSEDELTHYSSSLNASVSSIPTLCDDREESPESLNSSTEESPRESPGQEKGEGEGQDQETEAARHVITEGDEVKVDEEEDPVAEDLHADKEEERSHNTPPDSRQVSGRSATPRTVAVSEFDDVESTIFYRRELSRQGSSSRNALTSSANSRRSDVSIKNWAEFGERGRVTSNVEEVTEVVDCSMKDNVRKRLMTRKMRNAKQGKTNIDKTKVVKQQPALQRTGKKTGDIHFKGRPQLKKQSSHSSDNSDVLNTRQQKLIRRKRRPVKQVSFDNFNIQNSTKISTSDSAFFGSRTESRGDEKSSTKPPESEHSGRVSSRWTGAETERVSSTSTRPVSTVQSPRSNLSTSQRSGQTSLVDVMTAVNYPPAVIYGKKSHLPSMRPRRHGKGKTFDPFDY